ncbi:hypothetical protein L8V01_04710 [Corynebacterium sp. c8Ua_181]|uniref:SWIM-type domain-containing protein n=1 Tax=Corynebacterium curieae TaxID=2913500 RepID=A0A9X3M9R3_9CORY|nr:SWIM zinc finger family protein [Corynebacterium curieae]MCZ9306779.1 hypothetical protein [Corynebacterium curieae]MDV2423627.1 hypothetical protein [Corynebacterium curieae]
MSVKGDDNVIYANFGTRKRVSTADEVNHVDRSGRILSTTAARIAAFTSHGADRGRITRGRQYAEGGHVVGLEVRNGAIHGRVAGSQNEPFAVLIQLPYRNNDDIAQLATEFARTPNSVANARKGLLADAALDTLFAPEAGDLRLTCDCPDGEYVCKHIVAVGDKLATRADADPAVIFNMRGLDFARLERMVLEQAKAVSRESFTPSDLSEEEKNDIFWNGRELPKLPQPKVAPAIDDSDPDLLRKAMRSVSHTNLDLLRAVSDIEDLYYHLTH